MRPKSSSATRYIQDGLLIYSSGTLLHQRNSCRGYLKKAADEARFFSMKQFYKRYFIITNKQNFIQVQELPVTKKYKRIEKADVVCLNNISKPGQNEHLSVTWKWSFEL